MGPEAANPIRASTPAVRGSEEERHARLRAVGELVRLAVRGSEEERHARLRAVGEVVRLYPAVRGSEEERHARLRAVGEVVRLYEGLERALQTVSDDELARLATAARAGERALDRWARSVEVFRRFKRRIDAGLPPADETLEANDSERATEPEWLEDEDWGPPRFLWEALAFAIGFIVSFLVT